MDNSVHEKQDFLIAHEPPPRVRIIPPEPGIPVQKTRKRVQPDPEPLFNPDDYGEMIPEDQPRPICEECAVAFVTWAGFEYHVLRFHIQYRPYRCAGCKNLSFHTEAEGRHHSHIYHNPSHAGFSLIKRTDFELENVWMECLMNAKMTNQVGVVFSQDRLEEGLEMVKRVQMVKFRGQRAQLPHCIRHEIEPIEVGTDPEDQVELEVEVEEVEAFQPEEVEAAEYFDGESIEYAYQEADILEGIP
uniref:C2H2-type domain-containing protein n=1 Tax=Caenorhabditis tropicalis TaxID=1561998 RepID=A0A1I7V1G7_9PELO